jgi:hypothetical protein
MVGQNSPRLTRPAAWVYNSQRAGLPVFEISGLEIAIFGFFPGMTNPETIQNTGLIFVLISAILNVISFIAGFGHELRKMNPSN